MTNPSFCVLPWIHAHMNGDGKRFLCCRDKFQSQNIEPERTARLSEFWNGSYMRKVRLAMLAGEPLSECAGCTDPNQRIEAVPMREYMNDRYAKLIPTIKAATAADGSTTLEPFYFDYRHKSCQLKCRTCGDHSSTSILNEIRENASLKGLFPHVYDPAYATYQKAAQARVKAEHWPDLLDACHRGTVRVIYWAGGEPLINSFHWEALEILIANGTARHVSLEYNSNLMVSKPAVERLVRHFGAMKAVIFRGSADGFGPPGEYVRSGFVSGTYEANVRVITEARLQNVQFCVDMTMTNIGLLNVDTVLDFAVRNRVQVVSKLMLEASSNIFLSLSFLPSALRRERASRARTRIRELLRRDRRLGEGLTSLDSTLALLESDTYPEYSPWKRQHALEALSLIDHARGGSFFDHLGSARAEFDAWLAEPQT